jgi:hypothetical protein
MIMDITTYEELEAALAELLGDGVQLAEADTGELVIFTGLVQDEEGNLDTFLSEEDVDDDLELDEDGIDLEDDE